MKKGGFTLVELLVVMAIIAILATIVVPNVAGYIRKARATRALAEIKNIELVLTKMMADADRGNLNHLFNANALRRQYLNYTDDAIRTGTFMTSAQFQAAQAIYTATFYALLREGRAVINDSHVMPGDTPLVGGTEVFFADILNTDIIKKLGANYLDLEFDPWGNLYQIYPGPWPSSKKTTITDYAGNTVAGRVNPNVFRTYLRTENTDDLPGQKAQGQSDGLYFEIYDAEADNYEKVSYPAPLNKTAFVYSAGANLISGQMVYNSGGNYTHSTADYAAQDESLCGGGDDVNNWDNGRSWERFYN